MKNIFVFIGLMAALLAPARALAQNYNIGWYKVSGGGGTSIGSPYVLSCTIGQHDASTGMTGGNYVLTGGFWALDAMQTPGAPLLTIKQIGGKAVVSWDPSITGWTLQTNVSLSTPAKWGNYLGPVINNSATNTPPPMNLFFRLKQ